MGNLSNDGGDNNKIDKKAIGLDKQNNNYACASHFFCISWQSFHECDMNPLNFMCPLYGVGEHSTEILFVFFLT